MALVREDRRLVCSSKHSFDIGRSGYINLLQPQDRRSKQPGDAASIVAARRRMHDCGATVPLLRAIADILAAEQGDVVLDAGCGDGFYLSSLARETGFDAHGVDISIPAIDAAARRYPECEWIVANADRFLPYADRSFSIIMSITARMNAEEFRRVLRDGGRLLVALPAPEDLTELRGAGRDRVDRTIETFAQDFTLAERRRVTATINLDADEVSDVLRSIYRPMQARPAVAMPVTLGLDLLLFRTRAA
jgi:23S rRNA (guanine745-N1)-methyltransferase